MANPTNTRLRRLVLSATELRVLVPKWPPALVEDYLNILDDLITLANEIDTKGSVVPGDADNIATLIGDGNLQDSGIAISVVINGISRVRQYFYSGF